MRTERVTLIFSADAYEKPITYQLVTEFSLKINILKAEVTPGKKGHLLLEMEGTDEAIRKALLFLQAENVRIIPTNKQISVDKEQCIHCGACTAVCFSQAMFVDRNTWKIEFNPDKCIACGLCISSCPLQLISSNFGLEIKAEK